LTLDSVRNLFYCSREICGFSRNPRTISMGDDPDTKDPSSRGECTARHMSDKSNVR